MYRIVFDGSALADMQKLDSRDQDRVIRAVETKLATDPTLYGKPLHAPLATFRSVRVGAYRIVYAVQGATTVRVVIVGNRQTVYQEALKRLS